MLLKTTTHKYKKIVSICIIKFSKNKIQFFLREKDLSKPSKTSLSSFIPRTICLRQAPVIHPHVLVGIPCYDFTPVTCPTLGDPLHYWLGYRLQVLQTPMA